MTRIYNSTDIRIPAKGEWSGISLEPYETKLVEAGETLEDFLKVYTSVKVLPEGSVELKEEEENIPSGTFKVKERVVVREKFVGFRGPDYLEETEKRMRKYIPLVKVWRFGIYRVRPFIRYE